MGKKSTQRSYVRAKLGQIESATRKKPDPTLHAPRSTLSTPFFRLFTFDRAQLNVEERTVPVAFSSELPVDRGDYDEILDHTPEGCDLSRVNDGGHPYLLNHDMDKQIGVIDRAELSEAEKKARAVIRFSRSALGEEIFQDVKDGIRKHMSVGYERLHTISSTKTDDGRRAIRFAWRPYEISSVPVPADPTVGVGRAVPCAPSATRTWSTSETSWNCRDAVSACNRALEKIENCAADPSHQAASASTRAAVAQLALTAEDLNSYSEATAADCVRVCAESPAYCDAATKDLRAILDCGNCRKAAGAAIQALEQSATDCRENAGLEESSERGASERASVAQPHTAASLSLPKGEGQGEGSLQPSVDSPPTPSAPIAANQSQTMLINRTHPLLAPDPPNAPAGGAAPQPPAPDLGALRIEAGKSATDAERARVKKIRAAADAILKDLPEGADKFRILADKAVDDGTNPEDFNAQLLAALPGVRKTELISAESIGMSRREINQYSLGRAIQSVLKSGRTDSPEGLEGEVHKAMCSRVSGRGVEAGGFWVPHDIGLPVRGPARRDLNVTNFGQGGAFVQTTILTPIIEILRNRMVTARLGVQQMGGLEGNVAIPRQTGAATAYSLPESGTITKSTQALDQITLTPHKVGVTNDYTKRLLLQSSVDVENFIRDDMMKVLGIKWDRHTLEGSGANDEPTGVLNTQGIGSVHFGATPTLAKIIAFETALALANADMGSMAYICDPLTRATLKSTAKLGTTFPIFIWEKGAWNDGSNDGEVNSYRAACTNQISGQKVAFGHWSDAVVGLWGGFDVTVNPYSRDVDAVVRVTINTFGDVAVRHAASFAWSDDAGNQ